MDPLTAALQAIAAIANAYTEFLKGATAAQRAELVQFWIDDQKRWRDVLDRLAPKGSADVHT